MRSRDPAGAATKVRKAVRPTWMATYPPANSSARSPKASGIATAITRLASITAINTSRTTGDTGSSSLVAHVV